MKKGDKVVVVSIDQSTSEMINWFLREDIEIKVGDKFTVNYISQHDLFIGVDELLLSHPSDKFKLIPHAPIS